MADLLDAVEAAYRDVAAGRDRSPLRSHVELAEGALLLMPGVREGGAGASVKLVTVMPRNAQRGLPTIHASSCGSTPTAGAAGAARRRGGDRHAHRCRIRGRDPPAGAGRRADVGHDRCRRPGGVADPGRGRRAPDPARARLRARRLATRGVRRAHGRCDGPGGGRCSDPEEAVAGADIMCCATTSTQPMFAAAWVRPGTHVNAHRRVPPGMVELPPGFRPGVAGGGRLAGGRLAEAGDVMAAIEAAIL